MFFPPPSPKKRKKCGHRKCRPKGTQVTKGQDGQISHLSLFCVAHASIHSSSSRKKRRHRITRPKKAQRILPPSRFSRACALEMVVLFHQSARARRRKRASARGRKTNKQTKDGGTKNLKKVPTWHFSASKARQTFRG